MLAKLVTIGKNSVKRRNFSVMAHKVMLRIRERHLKAENDDVRSWCAAQATDGDTFMKALDPALWQEAQDVCVAITRKGEEKLAKLGLDLGGGGYYPLLYFFTRLLNPSVVVETGVAAGWSSQAFLLAMKKNSAGGKLYSSDFPYFRYENPEKLVGYIVDDELRPDWALHIDGDENNLPKIVAAIDHIDFLHYDSDKSYAGRELAVEMLLPLISPRGLVIFDDIQDNFHFRDFCQARGLPFRIFGFGGKYVGLCGGFIGAQV